MFVRITAVVACFALLGCNKNMADGQRPAGKSLLPAASQPSGGATAGQLPKGHPPLGKMPKGHPPMGGMPSGHPRMPKKGGLVWKAPPSFKSEAPANRFRIAQYRLAGAGKEAEAMLVVSHFPGMGGSTADNIKRWHQQIEPAAGAPTPGAKTRKVNGLEVVTTFAVGSYMQPKKAMQLGGPKIKREGWAILGAVVATPSGP
ncbi:MAG: hypothetical protein KC503_24485 [Myxococcales bacterium]|nr:hypothetical protein [Myxococcales bacterium]